MIVINFYEVLVIRRTSTHKARWLFRGEPSPIFSERRTEKIIGYKGLDAYGVHVERMATYRQDSTFEVRPLGQAEPPLYPIRQRLTFTDTKGKQPRAVVAVCWTERGWRYLTQVEDSEIEHSEPEINLGSTVARDRWVYESQMRQPSIVSLLD